ncbi:MAG: DUF2382 domain-containing protein [Pseudomonas sp.]|nr:MAG: DUF2382 domain-containing protein [Pseudomonas sp.]
MSEFISQNVFSDALTNALSKKSAIVPLIEESLVIDKRVVDQGGYRIIKKVHVREEIVDEPLNAHSVHVERLAIGQLLTSMDIPAPRQEGNTLIISVVEEVLVTEKRLFLKEELHITQTDVVTRNPVTHSLRSEDVTIERLEPGIPPVAGML